jgi:hypothetical protein
LALVVVVAGCHAAPPGNGAGADGTRVLFVGNSYTYYNDLPQLFERLADAAGHPVVVDDSTQPSWTLQQHAGSDDTLDKIARGWDFVVLQEQSVRPAVVAERERAMYPAARELDEAIRRADGRTVFYMTWGRRSGRSPAGHEDFASMQAALRAGYSEIARELDAMLAPVGDAWESALSLEPQPELYEGDGSHPSLAGSYLAACVFFAVIFDESPVGLDFTAGLDPEPAATLQRLAAQRPSASRSSSRSSAEGIPNQIRSTMPAVSTTIVAGMYGMSDIPGEPSRSSP